MNTINIKKGTIDVMAKIDFAERQPCWHITLDDQKDRDIAKWVVGVKTYNENDQNPGTLILRLADLGDVSNEVFWAKITSEEFAVGLLDAFRRGDTKAWIKKI